MEKKQLDKGNCLLEMLVIPTQRDWRSDTKVIRYLENHIHQNLKNHIHQMFYQKTLHSQKIQPQRFIGGKEIDHLKCQKRSWQNVSERSLVQSL